MEVNVNEQQIVMLAGMWVSIHGDRFKGEGGGVTFCDAQSIIR